MRLQAGEADKVFGEIKNTDRLTHVEHESFTTIFHRGRLQNKINSFRNGHKEAIHIGMSNGNGPAIRDLRFEDRDDTAATAKHVPKADDGEGALVTVCGIEYDHFRETFGGPINAGWSNSFVCRDQHKAFDICSERGMHNIVCTHHIVR